MHKFATFLLFGLLALSCFTACTDDEPSPGLAQTLVFGSFYGECSGESCIEIYKLDRANQTLSEDTRDLYPTSSRPYDGQYLLRSPADYAKTQALAQQVPAALLSTSATVIGQPDAGDWGGYYVEVNDHGTRRFWLIDTQKKNIPPALHAFTDSLAARINALQ